MFSSHRLLLIAWLASLAAGSAPAQDNSRTSLDWAGIYQGTLPCADCEGIATQITLKPDNTFRRSTQYLGKDDYPRRDQGEFVWNQAGSKVTVGDQQYQVGEGRLFFLDQQGERITGALAENYQLMKKPTDPRLEGRDWRLTELFGKPVTEGENRQIPSLRFHAREGFVSGSDGCNRLRGAYQLNPPQRLSFERIAGTMMACPDMSISQSFTQMLQQVGDYQIVDGELQLFKGRMAVMARFTETQP